MDLKYPGPGGYSLRTVHNPYGNGYSAILVGASDDRGLSGRRSQIGRDPGRCRVHRKHTQLRLADGNEAGGRPHCAERSPPIRDLGSLSGLRLGRLLRLEQHQQAHGDVLHDRRSFPCPRGRSACPSPTRRPSRNRGDRRGADREQARSAGRPVPLQRHDADPVLGPDRGEPGFHR